MKRIDDKDVLNKFNQAKDYEIKKDSNDVLNHFLRTKNKVEVVKETPANSKKKKFFTFGGIGVGAVALTGVALSLFFTLNIGTTNSDNPGGNQTISPNLVSIKGNVLADELMTFTSFKTESNASLSLNRVNFSKRVNSVSKSTFERIVDNYDAIESGVREILNKEENIMMESQKEAEFSFEGKTYYFVDNYYSSTDNFKTPFMSFYYTDKNIVNEVSANKSQNGLIKFEDSYYECSLRKENEYDDGEYEEEINILLVNTNNKNEIIHIEKENEYEGQETENSYQITYYDTLNDVGGDDNFSYRLVYEIESKGNKEELEIKVEKPNLEYEFKNIQKVKDEPLTYTFISEYEEENYREVEGEILVNLEYSNDSRIYSYGDLTIIK